MRILKRFVKLILSDYLISQFTGLFYGWHGNYRSWHSAKAKCKGYEEKQILEKVLVNAIRVKNGEIAYERDSVAFDKISYSFPVSTALIWIASRNNNSLNIIDFGGSLGTSYYQNLTFLKTLSDVNWCVVEQEHFVTAGIKHFADNNLHFYKTIGACRNDFDVNSILVSSVLQYIERPYDLIEEIISSGFENIIIDRTLFTRNNRDRLTIQKVPARIYKARYCCWFLNEKRFLDMFTEKYDLVYDFEIAENININSLYKGYYFKQKTNDSVNGSSD